MGYYFIDKFSLLHFSFGVIWNYIGLDLISLIILHSLFEYIENTRTGMKFINNYFKLWPGGKEHPDSFINSISDILFSVLGWIFYEKYRSRMERDGIAILFLSNIFFYWMNNFQILIFLISVFVFLTIIGKINYIVYTLIGIGLGYLVSFIDQKMKLFY